MWLRADHTESLLAPMCLCVCCCRWCIPNEITVSDISLPQGDTAAPWLGYENNWLTCPCFTHNCNLQKMHASSLATQGKLKDFKLCCIIYSNQTTLWKHQENCSIFLITFIQVAALWVFRIRNRELQLSFTFLVCNFLVIEKEIFDCWKGVRRWR